MEKTHLVGVVLVGLLVGSFGYPQEEKKKTKEALVEEGTKSNDDQLAQRRSENVGEQGSEYAWSHQKIELKEHHQDPKIPHHHHQHEHIKTVTVTKKVPKPYPVEVEKKVPYEVKVPVDRPYPVYIPQPYPVYIEKKVPFEVKVPVPQPFTIEKKVPYEVKVEKPYPVPVDKPYTVYVQKKIIEKRIPYTVKVPVEKPYSEEGAVEKGVPYHVEKVIHYPVKMERPESYYVEKPYSYTVEKKVPYKSGGYKQEGKQEVPRNVPQVTEQTDEGEPLPRPAAFRNVFSDTEEFVSTTVQVKDPKEDEEPEQVSTSYSHSSLGSQGQQVYSTNIHHY